MRATESTTDPGRNRAERQRDEGENRSCGEGRGGRLSHLGRLLLRLGDGVRILLLVGRDLLLGLIHRDVLSLCKGVGGTIAGLVGFRLIPGQGRPHRCNRSIAQCRRIVAVAPVNPALETIPPRPEKTPPTSAPTDVVNR